MEQCGNNVETVWGNREQWNSVVGQWNSIEQCCWTVWRNNVSSVVEECGGIAEQYGGTKEQCDWRVWSVWNSVVEQRNGVVEQCGGTLEQYGRIVEQYVGTEEQCDGTVWAVWKSMLEQWYSIMMELWNGVSSVEQFGVVKLS